MTVNTNLTEAEPVDVDTDDPGGLHTLDNGHPASYDHEGQVRVHSDRAVTVTCSCGEWEATGEDRFGDEGDTAVLAAWEAHVYEATGQTPPDATPAADAEAELAEQNRDLRDEVERLQAEYAVTARLLDDAVTELAKNEADRDRISESLKWAQFILWGELALNEAKMIARHGRWLKEKLRTDPATDEAWAAFRDALGAACGVDLAEEDAR